MPKKPKPGRKPAAAPEVQEVTVQDVKSVARMCRDAISRVLNQPQLDFSPVKYGRRTQVRLNGIGSSLAFAREQYNVVFFLKTRRVDYWLAASLEFDSPPGMSISHLVQVSLLVFEGLVTDEQKRPVLRAEWDCKGDYLRSPHAQPHWHVYSSLLNQESLSSNITFDASSPVQAFSGVEQSNDVKDFGLVSDDSRANDQDSPIWPKGDRFHFAMAARWQLSSSEERTELQNDVLDPSQLGNWIERCLSYIAKQLKHVDK
ncbi:MAG TPA: hypothetical protein VEX13_01385 [Chloroflexia bacterium]|nr:hypothetical protein [Chloroflexia bacterium]